jgi:hypothetical protein
MILGIIKVIIKILIFLPITIVNYYKMKKNIKIKKNEWAFPMYLHMGDTYVMCSLMKCFKERHDGNVLVIVPKRYKHIPKLFKGVDRVEIFEDLIPQHIYILFITLLVLIPRTIREKIIEKSIKKIRKYDEDVIKDTRDQEEVWEEI